MRPGEKRSLDLLDMATARFGLTPDRQRLLSRLLQVSIGAILFVGLARRNSSVVVNAALALGASFLPAVVSRDYRIPLNPGLLLWITTALFLHSLGMLGLYDDVWWFDHVTHTLSATIVAAVGYVTARAIDVYSDEIYLPPRFMALYILLFTLAFGVFWEELEFAVRVGADVLGFDPILIQYGLGDSLADLVFDSVGALLVAFFGTQLFSDIVDALADRLNDAGVSNGRGTRADSAPSATAPRNDDSLTALDDVLRTGSSNARVSWVVLAVLGLVVVERLVENDPLWAGFTAAVLVVALVPAAAYRNPRVMVPWRLLVLASLPVIGRAFLPGPLTSDFATYLSVAAIALLLAAELHVFTPVEMTPTFAVVLVVVTTTAAAGLWAIVRWGVDLWFGTAFLLTPGLTDAQIEDALMWSFVYSTLAGLFAGVLFEFGFRRREQAVNHERARSS